MNKYIKNLLILLQLGGGFMGLVVTALKLLNSHEYIDDFLAAILGIFIFSLGIFSGFSVIKKSRHARRLSIIYQILQIPVISLAFFGYECYSGFIAALYYNQEGFTGGIMLGSHLEFSFLTFGCPTVGINFFAIIILFILIKSKAEPKHGAYRANE